MTVLARPRFERAQFREVARQAFEREFDPTVNLVGAPPFFPPPSLGYAWVLLDEGSPEAIARAEAILTTVLSSQELRPGHPDYGHFRMRFLDPCIADLNAVQLFLIEIIPIAKIFGDRFSPALRGALRTSIQAGLRALDDIDAHLTYSNVAVLDVANRILGGEFLGDTDAVERGVAKLDDFLAYTNQHGGFRDYNSPTYLGQMLSTVATLANHTAARSTGEKAEMIQERLWLQAATHYHLGLAQFAGPYCRAYPPDVVGASGQMKSILYAFLDEERLLGDGSGLDRISGFSAFHLATRIYYVPDYLLRLLTDTTFPAEIREGAERDSGLALTSYLGASHTLGTAATGFGSQARNLIVHAAPRASATPKVLFSRYLAHGDPLDLNTFDERLAEWGVFAGLQRGTRAIALYGARLDYRKIDWLGVELFLFGAEADDAVWSDERPVQPGDHLPAGRWLILDLGTTYVALYPLVPTPLGDGAATPVSLHREDGALRLTIANYDGPAKHFWKYAAIPWEYPEPAVAPFFNGHLRAGFVVETADAGEWDGFAAFRRAVAGSRVTDAVEATVRRVTVERDGHVLELAVDLMTFAPIERRIDGLPEGPVFLEAPTVVQLAGEEARIDGRTVGSSQPGPWVVVDEDAMHLANPTPVTVSLRVGETVVDLPPFGRAAIDRQGRVELDTVEPAEPVEEEDVA